MKQELQSFIHSTWEFREFGVQTPNSVSVFSVFNCSLSLFFFRAYYAQMKIRSSFNGCALSRLHSLRSSLLISIALAAWTCATAQAADITILVNQGAVSGVRDLAAGYEKATGNKVIVDFAAGGQQDEKIRTDAPGDLVVIFLKSFDALIKEGKVIGPVVEFARAGNGV